MRKIGNKIVEMQVARSKWRPKRVINLVQVRRALRDSVPALCIIAMLVLPAHAGNAKVICIDPGHPSESGRGTTGRHLSEIDAAWDVARLLKADLEADGYRVVMTKTSAEEFVTNKQRAEIANRSGASLLIRLHCDADAGTGLASYAPDRQGIVNGVKGPSALVIGESQEALRIFHPSVIKSLSGLLADRGMHPDTSTRIGGLQGALTGSIFSKVPVILVEMCVLTNPRDEAIMSSATGQRRIALALAAGSDYAVREVALTRQDTESTTVTLGQ